MTKSSDLLLAYYTGVRMALQAYGIKEPPLGENRAVQLLFEVANSQNCGDDTTHFNREIVQGIVDGLLVGPRGH